MLFLVKCSDDSQKYYYAEKADEIVQANSIEDVLPAINNISSLQKSGYTLAGWISYEASPAFDPRHKVISSGDLPLLYFMASKNVRRIELSDLQSAGTERASKNSIAPHINQQEYEKSCSDVLDFIHEGDIYQANYSFRCDLELAEDPLNLFLRLEKEHPVPYSFYLDNGDWQIVSQSPELFIKKEGRKLTSDPMKGTIH
ncbi:MAG: chorismate-binding protein, partial [Lentisphaeraceae bacterium]|nr:chorismate-binding protein [Lentisphaeraceae bacterium]